ncbi:hypothetical protein [Burkholderia phage BCSR5]|nr:hypothetical protein [Burkholderia phage BCSR5]
MNCSFEPISDVEIALVLKAAGIAMYNANVGLPELEDGEVDTQIIDQMMADGMVPSPDSARITCILEAFKGAVRDFTMNGVIERGFNKAMNAMLDEDEDDPEDDEDVRDDSEGDEDEVDSEHVARGPAPKKGRKFTLERRMSPQQQRFDLYSDIWYVLQERLDLPFEKLDPQSTFKELGSKQRKSATLDDIAKDLTVEYDFVFFNFDQLRPASTLVDLVLHVIDDLERDSVDHANIAFGMPSALLSRADACSAELLQWHGAIVATIENE